MFIKFGNWLFHYRNFLFPLFYLILFIPSFPILANQNFAFIAGAIIIFLGMFTRAVTIGLVYIVRGGKYHKIYAEKLVVDGIYSICRNPMYLGNILLLLGFALFSNSLFFLISVFPVFCFIYYSIIKAEESFLMEKFGNEFTAYCRQTKAIIPDLKALGKAFKNYRFNFVRVIIREYNSTYVYLCGILMLLVYKNVLTTIRFSVTFGILTVLYFIIKVLKKREILKA